MQKSGSSLAANVLTKPTGTPLKPAAIRAAFGDPCIFCRRALTTQMMPYLRGWLCLYLHMFVCACTGGGGGAPRVCAGVRVGGVGGRGWRREAQLCSLIFWERSGGVVDPPAPFSSAGSRRISAAASLHKATLCDLPQAHKYNCNQERREGGGTVDSGGTRRKRPLTVLRLHQWRWKMAANARAP